MNLVLAFFIAPLMALVLIPALGTGYKGYAMVGAVLLNACLSAFVAVNALQGSVFEVVLPGNMVTGPIAVTIDGLSAWFILIADFVVLMGAFFGQQYLKHYRPQSAVLSLHMVSIVVLHTAIVALCSVQNSFVFLVFWEIMALSAFLALLFEHSKPVTLRAGINYLLQSHLSIVALMLAFIWVAYETGSFDFGQIRSFTEGARPWISTMLFVMLFTGFGIKAGFVPGHTWLPHAHPAAPSHISGILSGVVVKTGIYGILRMMLVVKADYQFLGCFVLIVSVAGGLFGIINAGLHRDIKRMLAYCTIENIGIVGIGIGLGMLGMATGSTVMYYLGLGGALLHVLNHALFKSLLFFSAGSVYVQTHTRNMDHLGGLAKQMPQTTTLFLLGALAIGGLPPLNGFVSEFVLYSGLVSGIQANGMGLGIVLVLTLGGLAMIGGLSVLTFTKTFGVVFLGTPRSAKSHQAQEVPFQMLWPQYLILAAMLAVASLPNLFLGLATDVWEQAGGGAALGAFDQAPYSDVLFGATLAGAVFIVVLLLVWGFRSRIVHLKPQNTGITWGCGYAGPASKLQYTGKSFSKPLGKVFGFLAVEEKHFEELSANELFPARRKYVTHYLDFFESKCIDPLTNRLVYSANYFKFIQNGKVQSYVLYGILFVVAVFLFTYLDILLQMLDY